RGRAAAARAARHVELREPPGVAAAERRLAWEDPAPDLRALMRVGERKLDGEAEASQKGWIEGLPLVRREDREAAVGLHPLQEVADLDVRVAVVAVLHLAAPAEERIGLVEEQDRAALVGGVEEPAEVLLRLADVLADDGAEVDPVEVEPQLPREDLGGRGLPGAARSGEQGADAEPTGAAPGEAPVFVDARAPAHVERNLVERRDDRLRE